jgi:hypothetical protein
MRTIQIDAVLRGLAPLMFDRFFDHSSEDRPPEQKLYLQDGRLVMPAANLVALLTNDKPPGAIKMTEKKKAGDYLPYVKGHVHLSELHFPILDGDGAPIKFTDFTDPRFYIDRSAPRVIKGSLSIKQPPKARPVLKLPWSIQIGLNLIETEFSQGKITPDKLYSWFVLGGLVIGLGTYRPLFGRFEVPDADWRIRK